MEPQYQISAPKTSSKSKGPDNDYYFDLLSFANLFPSPPHPRRADFLISTPESHELLNHDCRCPDSSFFPDENTGKMVCKCTLHGRLLWHKTIIKQLLCASLFEHRFLLAGVQKTGPYYKKHVRMIEESKELCHLADEVEREERAVHLTTSSQNRSTGRGVGKVSVIKDGSWCDGNGRKEGRAWWRFWGMFTSSTPRGTSGSSSTSKLEMREEMMSSVLPPDEDDPSKVKVKKLKFQEQLVQEEHKKERKMETKVLTGEDFISVKKGNIATRSTTRRNTEMEGRGGYDDQSNVTVDDRAPPPPYRAASSTRTREK